MRLLLVSSVALLLVPISPVLYSQVPNVTLERVSATDRLEGAEVHCILQDHRGFLWVGTEKALNRYDGYSFTVFKHDPMSAGSIVFARVQSLCEDRRGVLWVGTYLGLERFDRFSETFTHFVPEPVTPGNDWCNVIYGMCEDSHGNLLSGALLATFAAPSHMEFRSVV